MDGKNIEELNRHLVLISVVFLLVLSISSAVEGIDSTNTLSAEDNSIDYDNDGLKNWQEELMGTDKNDTKSPGLYCLYEENYRTKNYNSWKKYTDDNGTFIVATERVVIRRGSDLKLYYPNNTKIEISKTKDDMTKLNIADDGGKVEIPKKSTVGKYILTASKNDWTQNLEIFVLFDPFKTSLSDEKINAYAYDEDGSRDERGYIHTPSGNIYKGELNPFGNSTDQLLDIYEFALAGIGNTSDPIRASVKLSRIVAQRNKATPKEPPQLRDPRKILFYNQGKIEGLTIPDAKKLSMNGVDREALSSSGYTKTLSAWCDESAFALTGLLRSVGIPSRITSIHPSEDTQLMGHYVSEAWFDDQLYDADWNENSGDWYVLDADEWNAKWYTRDPPFWMPMGETFSSRANFGFAVEHLFRVNYKYEIGHCYVLGIQDKSEPQIKEVTKSYKDREPIDLKYGELDKFAGRGGGDFYKINIKNRSKLTIDSEDGINPNIYLNENKYPALKISYQGYPPSVKNKNLTRKTVILKPGTYYVGIFAPEEGDNSIEGNYGTYTLKLEETNEKIDQDITDEQPSVSTQKSFLSITLLVVWIASFMVIKGRKGS